VLAKLNSHQFSVSHDPILIHSFGAQETFIITIENGCAALFLCKSWHTFSGFFD